jgi:CRP/FNR family transcriptional regulator
MEKLTDLLPGIFLFDSLKENQLKIVAGFCSIVKIKKNDHLFFEGDEASAFYHIVSGSVKIYKISPQGNEHIIEIHDDGNLVAEAAIFDRKTYPAYCQALTDAIFIKIPRNEFIELIGKNPEISLKIIHSYSKRLRHFVSLVEKLSMHDIKSRLARYLIDNSTKFNNEHICILTLPKKELASVLGTIPETLSRTFRFFKKENMISEEKDRIIIHNIKKFKSLL